MRRIIILGFLLLANLSFSQRANNWQLGHYYNPIYPKSAINFNSGFPDTFSVFREMPFFVTNSIISDSNGEMLFYSNGIFIGNNNHDSLMNSSDFNPGSESTNQSNTGLNIPQACIILPMPGSASLYIIFHESGEPFLANNMNEIQPLSLRYTIIDITLDNGLGEVISKNLSAIADTLIYGKINACKHGNGRDWWIIAREYWSNNFYKLLLSPDTLLLNIQQIGSSIIYDVGGQAVFSPDGSKYVLLTQNHLLDIYDFNRCDGMLSNHISISVPDTNYGDFGCSISPNSRFLYVSNQYKIYQYDLYSPNIENSVITVAEWDTVLSPFATLFFLHQLGPDGKIYIGTYGGCNILHVIESPDSLGLSCNVLQNEIDLPGTNVSVPNLPNFDLGSLSGSICDSLTSINESKSDTPLQLKAFPNPFNSSNISINYTLEQNKVGNLEIINTTGQLIYQQTLPQWSSHQKLHLPEISDGIYLMKLQSGAKNVMLKIIKTGD